MDYVPLGRCGLKVAPICLGTMQFGWSADEEASRDVLDAYVAAGGNFIDTADVYSRWAEGNPGGVSEEIIGRWLHDRGNRGSLIIATKVRGTMGPSPNDVGLSRKHILDAAEASLRRLQIDYIDLYQAHSDDPDVPLEETLEAFDNLVQRGLVRYIGASNYSAWRLMKALSISELNGFAHYVSLQPYYNMVERERFERELQPLCVEEGVGVIPYSPLAAGFLTGKYRPDEPIPASARANSVQQRFMNDRGWRTLAAVEEVARRHNATPTAVTLAWTLLQPAVTSPIIGANSPVQLQDSLRAVDVTLTEDDLVTLHDASTWE